MKTEKPFFVGYLPVPGDLKLFLWTVTFGLVLAAGAIGYIVGTAQDNPGPAAAMGRQTVTGVIELTPMPILHVTEGTARVPAGRTLMMSGAGKSGVMPRAQDLDGQIAMASGALLARGSIEMLQLRGGRNGLRMVEGSGKAPAPVPLGRWQLAGEICDGKCLTGAMRPGRGLAHKACANLCIAGGVPPVFVSTQPVEGSEFLMISGPDGGPLPQAVYDHMAQYISVEGDITRHGDLLVLAIDPETVEVLP